MATRPIDDEPLELTEEYVEGDDLELPEDEDDQDDGPDDSDDDEGEPEEDGEDVVSFGDEPAEAEPPAETDLVKHLRKTLRERERELAQTRKAPVTEEPIVVGDRPKIEDFDYDQERFDAELDAWDARRDAKRQQDQRIEARGRQQNEAWEAVKANYATKKAALKFADKDKAEAAVFEALSPVQQAVIAKVAPDPALFVYAAYKNQARLNELAAIDDPLVLAAAIGKMGATLTMKKRTPATQPEKVISGGAPRSNTEKTRDKLMAKGMKSGDYSDLVKFEAKQGAK